MTSHVRVEMQAHGHGRVWVDGVEVQGVTRVSFSAGVRATNKVQIAMPCAVGCHDDS